MNPWGLMFIALGFLMIVIGFKGSQHSVMDAIKGKKSAATEVPKNLPKGVKPLDPNPKLA